MNLGGDIEKLETNNGKGGEGDKNGENKQPGKCKVFLSSISDAFGGMKIELPKGEDNERYFTRSYYHWEFIMHLQKAIMQLMVILMYDFS